MEKLKVVFLIVVGGLVLVALFQSFIVANKDKTEEQKYSLIRKYNDFEIRFYPSAIVATVYSNANTYKELSGQGFRQLAGYIFGGNETKKSISMTAPVSMDINDSMSSMSFVMPAEYNINELPKPDNSKVNLSQTTEEYVAAIEFGGYASDKEMNEYTAKLKSLLKENKISHSGNFRFLGYNAPYEVVNRRNEIIVRIDWNEKVK
jgi:hypothetical protein